MDLVTNVCLYISLWFAIRFKGGQCFNWVQCPSVPFGVWHGFIGATIIKKV